MKMSLVFGAVALILFSCCASLLGQSPVPAKYDGFPYGVSREESKSSILIEAFFDPLCPDSRDAWPPLLSLIQDYSPHLSLIVHPFPLPYHDNSYISCRALHIANKLNASAVYPLLELFFKYQGRFSNVQTRDKSRASIIDDMANFAVSVVGNSLLPDFQYGFNDAKTDSATRVSFKYGCSRGVIGTPFFLVNGFALPNAGSAIDYVTWKDIINPLLEKSWNRMEE